MAVAGRDCTIIATSGQYATVTPFSDELPVMEDIEIGDVAMAYDDPILLERILLIPTMDHNLLPPFLIREASLFIDETPKYHTICDNETGMLIDLQIRGTLSYFRSRSLTLDEQA
jgi:hypothetical protein